MSRTLEIRVIFLLVCATLFVPDASAQNNRSAVSVTGNDAAACTVPDPCRTFAVAQSKTNAGGEIVALTSGGYGPFTIDKSVTVVAAPGIYAALVATSGNAIFVNAGAAAKVVIRGLHLYGMGTGDRGISVTGSSEEVHIENCVIDGFANFGVLAFFNVRISGTTIRNCFRGIQINNATAAVKGTINRVGVRDSSDIGIALFENANVTVRDSVVADSSTGFLALTPAQLNIENSLATNNGIGIEASGAGATARVSNSMVTDNGTGLSNILGATIISWGNNKVQGNTINKAGAITVVAQD